MILFLVGVGINEESISNLQKRKIKSKQSAQGGMQITPSTPHLLTSSKAAPPTPLPPPNSAS